MRILGLPIFPLSKALFCKYFVSRKTIREGQGHEMLMTIRFPCDLAVAYTAKIKIRNLTPMGPPSFDSMDDVASPRNGNTVIHIAVSKNSHSMFAKLICFLNDLLNASRKKLIVQPN